MDSERSRPLLASCPAVRLRARVEAARPLALRLGEGHPLVRGLGLHRPRPPAGGSEPQLPLAALDALWDAVVEREGPGVPLRLAQDVRASSFGLLTYLLGCAPSGQHALRRLGSAYRELLSEGTGYDVSVDRRHVEIEVALHGDRRSSAARLFAVASVVGFVAGEVEGAPRPCRVELSGAAPPSSEALACTRFFQGAVIHGAPRSRVVYDRAALERRLRGSDPALAEILEHAVRSRRSAATPMAEALRQVLLAAGPTAAVGQAHAAAALGCSPRSLRRHLAEEGTSFQAVLDGVRQGWAEAWLAVPSTPIAAVADTLGYADEAAFRRAFRRWTGMSPAAWAGLVRRDQPGAPGTTPLSTNASPSTSSSSTDTATQLSTPSPTTSA